MKRNIELSDGNLVQMYKDGNSDALGIVFKRYENSLKNFIFGILKDKMQAEDVLQDVFEKALIVIKNGEYKEQGNLKAYLFRLAHNFSINFVRKKETKSVTFSLNTSGGFENSNRKLYLPVDYSKNPEEVMINAENKSKVKNLLSKLSRVQRDVIILRTSFDLKYREIAEFMDCSSSTNRGRIRNSIIKIKNHVKGNNFLQNVK